LPKSQFQDWGLPVERSWNVTDKGEHPETTLALKSATGACPLSRATSRHSNRVKDNLKSLVLIGYQIKSFMVYEGVERPVKDNVTF